jgi:hypothetical protein
LIPARVLLIFFQKIVYAMPGETFFWFFGYHYN